MKPIYVVIIAIVTGLISGGVGLLVGTGLGGFTGAVGGGMLGVCVTIERAKQENLLTEAEAEKLLNQIKTSLQQEWEISDQDIAQFNCTQVMQELNQ